MKKMYSKPEIFFENFSLSTNIAGNCNHPFRGFAQFVCGIPDSNGLGMNIFDPNAAGSTCAIPGDGMDDTYDGFCYHISTNAEGTLFNS